MPATCEVARPCLLRTFGYQELAPRSRQSDGQGKGNANLDRVRTTLHVLLSPAPPVGHPSLFGLSLHSSVCLDANLSLQHLSIGLLRACK